MVQATRFEQQRWTLDDAVTKGGRTGFGAAMKAAESKAREFESLRGRLKGFSKRDVESALRDYESVFDEVARATSYAFMWYTSSTDDQAAKSGLDAAEDLDADVRGKTLFFRLWWTGLSERRAKELAPADPDFRYVLSSWRKLKPFTLEEGVEKAVSLKNTTGSLGWAHHYDKLTSRFVFTLRVRGKTMRDERGRTRVMVLDEVGRLSASPDPEVRKAAYGAMLGRFAEEGGVLGEVYRTIVRDWRNENVKLRGYKSPISARNIENDVPDGSVTALLESCKANSGVFQELFRLKAKMLGLKKMDRRHIYAPLGESQRKVPFGDAVRTVSDAYSAFDSRMAKMMLRPFELGHVDSVPRKGKRSGAYCTSVTPAVVPYVFLNFSGTERDVYTMAHESGHAVHSQLASSHSVLTFQPPLVLAETASVFGEMILFDKLMAEGSDAGRKRATLLYKLSSMYATIGRQAHFVIFEKAAHEAVDSGATVEDLCKEYLANLTGQFGSAVYVPPQFEWEWTSIPHIFHTPFYCYAYAFGNLLSLALYDRYLKEGKAFVPDYASILSAGGSMPPAELLGRFGFDVTKRRFWDSGFSVVSRLTRTLQSL